MPVTEVPDAVGVTTAPPPLNTFHTPAPEVIGFALIVDEDAQIIISGPTFAIVGNAST